MSAKSGQKTGGENLEDGKVKLKVLRAMAGMTMDEVANKLEITRQTYSSWENYETFPNAKQLIMLSRVFNCSLDSFYFPIDTR